MRDKENEINYVSKDVNFRCHGGSVPSVMNALNDFVKSLSKGGNVIKLSFVEAKLEVKTPTEVREEKEIRRKRKSRRKAKN